MKKNLLLLILLFTSFFVSAQTIEKADALKLVTENAASIGLAADVAASAIISSAYKDETSGANIVYLQQGYKGYPVYNQLHVLAFKGNKLVSNMGSFVKNVDKVAGSSAVSVSAAKAVHKAFLNERLASPSIANPVKSAETGNRIDFGILQGVSENVTAELMWVPERDNDYTSLKLVWSVQIVPAHTSDWWLMHVDAQSGRVIRKINLTVYEQHKHSVNSGTPAHRHDVVNQKNSTISNFLPPSVTAATYNVIPYPAESPVVTAPTVVTNPWNAAGVGNNAITHGWHYDGTTDYNITRGNNVFSYLDVTATNAPNSTDNWPDTSLTPIPSLNFNFTPTFSQSPSTNANKKFAVANLFYWNNLMHDIPYQYGFNEVSGNFQQDNIGRGGNGNDYVNAQAQDGAGMNNANFATPSDGSKPRMRMYLWSPDTILTFHVNSPATIAGDYPAIESAFSLNNKLAAVGPVTGQVVYYNDDASGTTHTACSPGAAVPANSVAGKIAMIDRVTCPFVDKVKNAQNAGAIAVIMVNNVAGNPIIMGGTDNTITIPAVMISQANGAVLAAQLANNVNVTLSAVGTPAFDGDLDNGIVSHEYAHGISNRLTGGPSVVTCLQNAEQGGEGWSDYYALMMTTNWATATLADGVNPRPVGTYVINQPVNGFGIRNYSYSTNLAVNPLTYANMGVAPIGTEVHNTGEIWCMALWEMTWALISQQGSITPNLYDASGTGGNVIAFKLVTQGMKLQNCSPGFIDARNAILAADTLLYGGANSCTIWTAFAKRGMGWSASQGLSASATDQVASSDLPPAPSINNQPQSAVKCVGESVTFSVSATGAGLKYNWQVSTNGGSSWVNVSPANTTNSYTIASVTSAMNGYMFRVVVTGGCAPVTVNSSSATLTITPGASFTAQPSNTAVCAGANATFTAATSGTGLSYNWQVSTDGGSTWNNVSPAATTTTLTLTGVTTAMNNYQYRLVATGGCSPTASITSNAATLNVNTGGTTISSQPANTSACVGTNASFTIATSGSSATYVWQVSTDGGATWNNVSPAVTTPTINLTAVTASMNNYQYRVVVTSSGTCAGSFNSSAAVLTVNTAPSFSAQPANASGCAGGSASFTATVSGATNYQWQVSTTGCSGTFTNITGATTSTLNVPGITSGMNGYAYRLVTGNACSSNIISDCVTLTVNAALALTQQPASATVCVGANITFTTGSNISAASYNWQVSTDGGTTWSNVSPAVTTPSLTLNAVTASMNGYKYRAVVSTTGSCAATLNTDVATLTVNTPAAISSQPASVTTCPATNAVFTVAVSGTAPAIQWQVSTTGCAGSFTDISGANTATLTVANVTTVMSGYAYRAVVTNTCVPSGVTSSCVMLTVNSTISIAQQPTDATVCAGASVTFTTGASGSGINYKWQVSTDGGSNYTDIAGANGATYTIASTNTSMNNNRYRAVVTNPCNTSGVNTNAAILTVNAGVSFSAQPQSISRCTGTAQFSVTASGTGLSYQWQLSTDGGSTYNNILGAINATYTTPVVSLAMNNYRYRVVVSSSNCGSATSGVAVLTVGNNPVVTIGQPVGSLTPNSNVVLTANPLPVPGAGVAYNYQWYLNGAPLSGATASTYTVVVDKAGTYTVAISETTTGCTATSASMNVGESASSNVFVYPNPTSGKFWIRYYSSSNNTTREVSVFDDKGAVVFIKKYSITAAYYPMEINIANRRAGTYLVDLRDNTGKRLAVTKVVKN